MLKCSRKGCNREGTMIHGKRKCSDGTISTYYYCRPCQTERCRKITGVKNPHKRLGLQLTEHQEKAYTSIARISERFA